MQYLKLRPLRHSIRRQRFIRGAGTSWHSRSDSRASSFPSRQYTYHHNASSIYHLGRRPFLLPFALVSAALALLELCLRTSGL